MRERRTKHIHVRLTEANRAWLEELGGDTGITGAIDWLIRVGRLHQADLKRRRAIRQKGNN